MEYYDCYAASYEAARAKFLAAARETGGVVRSFPHPDRKTPSGGPLWASMISGATIAACETRAVCRPLASPCDE